jgi:hypothetical protein
MSLTRAQWIDMWRSVRKIEKYITEREIPRTEVFGKKNREEVVNEIEKVQDLIESVIGQMRP